MASTHQRHPSDGEPFLELSLRGVVDVVRETIAAHPRLLLLVVGGLAGVEAVLNLVRRYIDFSAGIGAGAIAMVIGILTATALPRMWSAQLGQQVDGKALEASATKLADKTMGSAMVAGFFASLGLAPLFVLVFFTENLPGLVFVTLFVVFAIIAIRVVMAVLLMIPISVIDGDTDSWLITRAWPLSRSAFSPLAELSAAVLAVGAGAVGVSILATRAYALAPWVEDFVVFPLANGLDGGLVVLASPAAYALARHGRSGYTTTDATHDLERMLEPAPSKAEKRTLFGSGS